MEKLKKLIEKKRQEGKGSLSEGESAARGSVLNDLIGSLDQETAGKVKGLKPGKGAAGTVTVASNTEAGLGKGLDTAKKLLQKHEGEMKPDSQEDEYDDQDAEGPNHMPTEKEASSFGAQNPQLGSPKVDGPEDEEMESEEDQAAEDADSMDLHEQIKNLKAEIASLRAPKSYY